MLLFMLLLYCLCHCCSCHCLWHAVIVFIFIVIAPILPFLFQSCCISALHLCFAFLLLFLLLLLFVCDVLLLVVACGMQSSSSSSSLSSSLLPSYPLVPIMLYCCVVFLFCSLVVITNAGCPSPGHPSSKH